MSTNIAALAGEITSDPTQAGYATMSDQQVADSLNAATVPAQLDVPVSLVMDTCMTRGIWGAIELLSRDAKTGVAAHDMALAAAIGLVRLSTATPGSMVQMSNPTVNAVVQAQLAALVAESTIGAPDEAAVLALASGNVSRAQSIGIVSAGGQVSHTDVAQARGNFGKIVTTAGVIRLGA